MIHRIYSDLESFKNLRFQPGFNILVAEKSPGATDKQTRNRAGKTSLIELIHFLTGASCEKTSIFRSEALISFTFGMEFDLGGSRVIVERSGENYSKVRIVEGNTTGWPVIPSIDQGTGTWVISNKEWRRVLGKYIFGLTVNESAGLDQKFGPTFRSLFPYFVRRQIVGGFASPVKHTEKQTLGDQQVSISYLLGIDWTISQKWQMVREREKVLKTLRKVAREGGFGSVIGSVAELRTKVMVSEDNTRRLGEALATFRVLPEYHELEAEASHHTQELGEMANANTIDRLLRAELEANLQSAELPSSVDVRRLYDEIGVVLPRKALKRFDEVQEFHESVIRNRKEYLSSEFEAVRLRIGKREQLMRQLDSRRSEIMSILGSYGALEHFSKLRGELSRHEAELELVRHQYQTAEYFEGEKTELEIERNQLLLRLRQDFHEQREALRKAILAFEETSRALYEDGGSLTINESTNGPELEISIRGGRSKGINNMQIFCFDMMLMRIMSERQMHPSFLVHDSHLFDGVDSRQVGKALQVGERLSAERGFQYIVTMNSDALPGNLPENLSLEDFIMPVRLTDATEDGGLFGRRFG